MEYFDIRDTFDHRVRTILNEDESKLNDNDKYLKEIFESICQDTDGKIPKEIGEMLVKENSNPDYTILIHRTSRVTKEELFHNGLEIRGGNNLDYTLDRYVGNNMSLLINVRDAYGYKGSYSDNARCVIVKIPNTALEYIEGKTKPILYQTDNLAEQSGGLISVQNKYQTVLMPEYILGTVEFDKNKMIEFEKNPEYRDIHDYKNDGLVCPEETIHSFIEKTMPNRKLSMEEIFDSKRELEENQKINSIISKQNEKYENTAIRTENEIKEYSKKDMIMSKFNKITQKIKQFFTKDKNRGEKDIGRE